PSVLCGDCQCFLAIPSPHLSTVGKFAADNAFLEKATSITTTFVSALRYSRRKRRIL
ncbi:unnamed protein product, partial [Angiostrongylus costaricensis]|uniref:DUF4708 domain-containing protein n=1 Tax=Angiostrongylus costaricensis TaxID=334426 RepID=A0A0R3PZA7_ANGCS